MKGNDVRIDCAVLGDFQTNCFVVRETEQDKECLVIDPGFSAEPLVKFLRQEQLKPRRIILTHGHCDHIAGIGLLREEFGEIPVAISAEDAAMLTDGKVNLSWLTGELVKVGEPNDIIAEGDSFELGTLSFKVLATPGHTPGGLSFYCEDEQVVFTGDTLFAGSIGRDDFPGGNREVLLRSIREKLLPLGDDVQVYSGHGPLTTIGQEKSSNPFLR
ncbi:MAG: MBL fold metallo-hydrolase [Sedimentisphaerales bacterium]|nr:MBL fold metallo-hydrolase [Sedimentisphaerales bacterium]